MSQTDRPLRYCPIFYVIAEQDRGIIDATVYNIIDIIPGDLSESSEVYNNHVVPFQYSGTYRNVTMFYFRRYPTQQDFIVSAQPPRMVPRNDTPRYTYYTPPPIPPVKDELPQVEEEDKEEEVEASPDTYADDVWNR